MSVDKTQFQASITALQVDGLRRGQAGPRPDSPIDELHEVLEGRRVDAGASFGAAFPYPKATYSKRKPRLVRDDEDGEARAADDTSRRVVWPHPRLAAL